MVWANEGWGSTSVASTGVPVVTGASANLTLPVTQNQNVILVSATGSPTSWAITTGDLWGNFSITSGGQLRVNYVDIPPQVYSLTVQATNATGSGSGTISVTVGVTGVIYHIATSGNDNNNGLTLGTAWLTFAKAAGIVNPGDAVLVHTGTYSPTSPLSLSRGGNASFPVIWAPSGTDVVTISAVSSSAATAFVGLFCNYTIFMGFNINGAKSSTAVASGSMSGVASFNATGVYFSHLEVHNFANSGINHFTVGSNNYTMFCTVHDTCLNNYLNPLSGGWGAGMGIYTANTLIYGNTVYHNWGEGIDAIRTNAVTIASNLVWDNMSVQIYIVDGTTNCQVYGNLCYWTGDLTWRRLSGFPPPGIVFANEGVSAGNQYNNVYNNVIIGVSRGVYYANYTGNGLLNNYICNNTIVNCNSASFYIEADAATTGNVIENNIIYGQGSTGTAAGCTFDYNTWFNSAVFAAGAHDVNANPQFTVGTGFVAANYNVGPASPCRNAGLNISSVIAGLLTDYGGNARPASGNVTIGAWQ